MMRGRSSFWRRSTNRIAAVLLAFYAVIAVAAPWLAPQPDPEHPSAYKVVGPPGDLEPHPPTAENPLGTAPGQIDVYFTLVWGTRSALGFGLTVALCTAVLGTTLGLLGGYAGGRAGGLITGFSDAFLSFPAIVAVWLFGQIIVDPEFTRFAFEGEPTWFQVTAFSWRINPLMLSLILFSWMPYTRVLYTQVALLKRAEYVVAAQAVGVGPGRLLLRYLLPNSLAPALVLLARDVGGMVVLAAAFNYIGFGGGPEWGALIVAGRDWIAGVPGEPLAYWWAYLPPTLALVFFGAGWNLLGDGLNAALDPRGD